MTPEALFVKVSALVNEERNTSKERKIIIHCCEGVDDSEAIELVQSVIELGKISNDGKSYCYGVTADDKIVSTKTPPGKSPETYTFHVYKQDSYRYTYKEMKPPEPRHPEGYSGKFRAYRSYHKAKRRCNDPNNNKYQLYGARGIRMCDKWVESFTNFFADMGERPEGTSLDRIDNSKGYEPGNCRWATATEQANNKRNNVRITYDDETLTLREWANRTGIKYGTIIYRRKMGWSIQDMLTKPKGKNQYG